MTSLVRSGLKDLRAPCSGPAYASRLPCDKVDEVLQDAVVLCRGRDEVSAVAIVLLLEGGLTVVINMYGAVG